MYAVRIAAGAEKELGELRAFDRVRIVEAIETQLTHRPAVETRRRKPLRAAVWPWVTAGPVWQLRVGELRVFYDIDEAEQVVIVQAVRRKPSHRTTKEIM